MVWGTGRSELARGFSRQHRIIGFASLGYASGLTLYARRIYLPDGPHPCTGPTTHRHRLPSCVTPSLAYYQSGSPATPTHTPKGVSGFGGSASLAWAWAFLRGYGNINPLSIDYACRPRLRSRLTLGGLAWPRNPWSSGGGGSHSPLATHACILTRVASTAGSLRRFTRHTTLPYPPTHLADAHHGTTTGNA